MLAVQDTGRHHHKKACVHGFSSGLIVKKLFSCSTQLSMKFQQIINVEIVEISGKFRDRTQQLLLAF